MRESNKSGFRGLIPDKAKRYLRLVRSWFLTIGLKPDGLFLLSNEERQASGKVSIIVAVHDAPEVTRRCLRSLEIFGGNAEIIIVDDASKFKSTRELLDN